MISRYQSKAPSRCPGRTLRQAQIPAFSHKYYSRVIDFIYYFVLLCTTKYYSSTTLYYTILQRTTPILLCTTKYYSSTILYYKLQYYFVLKSTTPVLLRTTKNHTSTTPYYTVLLRTDYKVLHSTAQYSTRRQLGDAKHKVTATFMIPFAEH